MVLDSLVSHEKVSKFIFCQLQSTQYTLNRFFQVSDFRWIDLHLLELIHEWVDSFLFETSNKTFWLALNRFIRDLNRIILHPGFTWINSYMFWIVLSFMLFWFVFCCLNRFNHLVNRFNWFISAKIETFHPLLYIHFSTQLQNYWIICNYSL